MSDDMMGGVPEDGSAAAAPPVTVDTAGAVSAPSRLRDHPNWYYLLARIL